MLTEHRGYGVEEDTMIVADYEAGHGELPSNSLSSPIPPPASLFPSQLAAAGSWMRARVPPPCSDCTVREPPQASRRDVTTERPRDPIPVGPWPKPGPSSATSMAGPSWSRSLISTPPPGAAARAALSTTFV